MATLTLYPTDETLDAPSRLSFNLYMITSIIAILLFMLLGLTMRLNEAQWISLSAPLFYQLLSMHGTGMIGIASLATTAVMWYFLRKYVTLHLWVFITNYALFVVGALCIVLSIFVGGYGALWTFLYPLPAKSMGLWSSGASELYVVGYILIGFGSLLFYLDAAAGIVHRYGGLGKAMGWQWLFGGTVDPNHPKAVIASAGVIIANSLGIIAGEVALFMTLVNLIYPDVVLNALLAKNLIYWFGHMYANATIYMGVIAVYELLPRYTGKPYVVSRPFIWAWLVTALYVIVVFPHHLFMDFAQPRWVAVMGQIASWVGGFPVFVITVYGALVNLYRSNIRWSMPSMLLILAMFGWAAGVVPAIMDGTIRVNAVMHNTLWVPGHFHFYMLLGMLPMVLALMYHEIGRLGQAPVRSAADQLGFPLFFVGALIFVLAFLYGGQSGVARRMAEHWASWTASDGVGAIGASLVVISILYFASRITLGLLRKPTA
ncbi:cbb3-type cytochrome c oxidase subunit I [Castellaniella sp.]|uniref:cbb3-type cytochrome c oxidase subunit I n=1 Tax=Castellaniella sp. TaxID=1955812 RepID=UPI003A8E1F4D